MLALPLFAYSIHMQFLDFTVYSNTVTALMIPSFTHTHTPVFLSVYCQIHIWLDILTCFWYLYVLLASVIAFQHLV